MAYSTTDGRIYIVELREPFPRLDIQFVPESLGMTRSANVQAISPVGRNNPLLQYTGGDEDLSLRVDFYADQEDRADVIYKCRWLQSLAQSDGGRKPQPLIKIVWGDLFQRSKWVVTRVRLNLELFEKSYGFLPRQAQVDMDMKLFTYSNVPTSDFRERQYGR